nr:acyltransferase [Mangrovicoccus ximenensis]
MIDTLSGVFLNEAFTMEQAPAAQQAHGGTHDKARPERALTTLQAGRALAAIAVVAFHAHVFYLPERLHPGASISPIFDLGYAGVEYFFVLSGFIMLMVHRGDIGRPARALRFVKKRLLRVLPFYWAVLLGTILLVFAQSSGGPGPLQLLHSIFLVPMAGDRPLIVHQAWTMSHEFLF